MDANIKARWIAELESGNRNQVTGVLENEEGNCCLGVLCRVMNVPVHNVDYMGNVHFGNAESNDKGVLPPYVTDQVDIEPDGSFPIIFVNKEVRTDTSASADLINYDELNDRFYKIYYLASLNDNGFTFAQIADLVRMFF